MFLILVHFPHHVNLPAFQHTLTEKNNLAFTILHFCFSWPKESEKRIYNKSTKWMVECSQARAGAKCRQCSRVRVGVSVDGVLGSERVPGGRLLGTVCWRNDHGNKQVVLNTRRFVMEIIHWPWSFLSWSPGSLWNFWTCQSSPFTILSGTLELLRLRFVDFTFLPFDETPFTFPQHALLGGRLPLTPTTATLGVCDTPRSYLHYNLILVRIHS